MAKSNSARNSKKSSSLRTLRRLIKYVNKYYLKYLLVVFFCILIVSICFVVASVMLQILIDTYITPGMSSGLDSVWIGILEFIGIIALVYLAGVIASFTYTRLMAIITQGTLMHFRKDMFEKMEQLPIKYYDTHPHGEIMSTYTNDVDAIRQTISQSMPAVIQFIFTFIALFIMMFTFSIWLTLIAIIFIALMLLTTRIVGAGSARYMVKQQEDLAAEEGFVEEVINGQRVVKVFNHEEEGKKTFDVYNKKLFNTSRKAYNYSNILFPIIGNLGNILYVVIAIVGAIFIFSGTPSLTFSGFTPLTIGVIVSFLTSTRTIAQNVGQTSEQIGLINMGIAGASRIFSLMDEEPEHDDGYVTLVNVTKDENGNFIESEKQTNHWAWRHLHKADNSVTYVELKGAVSLENVNFSYTPNKQILHDVSFYAKPGQKIALVGATGAGKTTITNLINRFYDIDSGKIRYDGININKIRKPDLRRSLGIVLQDINLYTGTVMENIRYGRLDATDEECIQAAKLANADEFITRLPQGYQTVLKGNASSLSQGQRQLISIARAAVANAPAMILDEATSSIDTHTEALVQAGMDNLMKGRTVFVIAHRLSTIKNSNAIIVMDHGRIIERGDHDDLVKQKGMYYQLYTGAFELE